MSRPFRVWYRNADTGVNSWFFAEDFTEAHMIAMDYAESVTTENERSGSLWWPGGLFLWRDGEQIGNVVIENYWHGQYKPIGDLREQSFTIPKPDGRGGEREVRSQSLLRRAQEATRRTIRLVGGCDCDPEL